MNTIIFFFIFIPILSIILLSVNFIFASHKPYKEKKTPFECGYHSFLAQNRTQFTISFFIFALLFLIFDLEIVLIYPITVSSFFNSIYGFLVVLAFVLILTLGFVFELGKKALTIPTMQNSAILYSDNFLTYIVTAVIRFIANNKNKIRISIITSLILFIMYKFPFIILGKRLFGNFYSIIQIFFIISSGMLAFIITCGFNKKISTILNTILAGILACTIFLFIQTLMYYISNNIYELQYNIIEIFNILLTYVGLSITMIPLAQSGEFNKELNWKQIYLTMDDTKGKNKRLASASPERNNSDASDVEQNCSESSEETPSVSAEQSRPGSPDIDINAPVKLVDIPERSDNRIFFTDKSGNRIPATWGIPPKENQGKSILSRQIPSIPEPKIASIAGVNSSTVSSENKIITGVNPLTISSESSSITQKDFLSVSNNELAYPSLTRGEPAIPSFFPEQELSEPLLDNTGAPVIIPADKTYFYDTERTKAIMSIDNVTSNPENAPEDPHFIDRVDSKQRMLIDQKKAMGVELTDQARTMIGVFEKYTDLEHRILIMDYYELTWNIASVMNFTKQMESPWKMDFFRGKVNRGSFREIDQKRLEYQNDFLNRKLNVTTLFFGNGPIQQGNSRLKELVFSSNPADWAEARSQMYKLDRKIGTLTGFPQYQGPDGRPALARFAFGYADKWQGRKPVSWDYIRYKNKFNVNQQIPKSAGRISQRSGRQ